MEKIYINFFEKILAHSDVLGEYIDSLYREGEYSNDELNQIFGVLKKEGLMNCIYADNRVYSASITFKGKHCFESSESLDLPFVQLFNLIDKADQIEKEFHIIGGQGTPVIDVISDKQNFVDWIQELKYELQELLSTKMGDKFIQETLDMVSKEFKGWNDKKDFSAIKGKLKVIKKNKGKYQGNSRTEEKIQRMKNKVFIVHGHDDAAKEMVARTVEKLGYVPIILHEQPSAGKTIIEKIEKYTEDVAFAVVLYTECDLGKDKNSVGEERYRARQNVVFEHGLLIGKLDRSLVFALVKGNVETPGDISGVVYTPMDEAGAWKTDLVRNMREVGLEVSADKLL